MLEKKVKTNSCIIAASLLQYSILIPVMQYISSTTIIALSSSFLLLVLLFSNRSLRISMPVFIIQIVITIIILCKIIIGHAEFSTLLYIYMFIYPTLILFIYPYNSDAVLKYSIVLSKIAFLVLVFIPFSSKLNSSYMRFGYGMLPVVIFSYIDLMYSSHNTLAYGITEGSRRKVLDVVIIFVGSVEIFLFGSRGGTFSVLLFLAIDRILFNKKKIVINSLVLLLAFFIFLNLDNLFAIVDSFLIRLGISSYSIMKFERQLSKGFAAASSSRDIIYSRSLEMIKKSPIIGNAISIDESGGDYAHNLFLQIGQDLGIFFVIIMIAFLVYSLYQIQNEKNKKCDRLIIMSFFSIAIGRLMFSSTIWRRPELWMLICFVFTMKFRNRRQKKG